MTLGHARYPSHGRYRSTLKVRAEALWVPGIPLAIHCANFKRVTKRFTLVEPRHRIVLDE
jgi:hypothetical protein